MFSLSDVLSSLVCLFGLCLLIPRVIRNAFKHNYDKRHEDWKDDVHDTQYNDLLMQLESINKELDCLKYEIDAEQEKFITEQNGIVWQYDIKKEQKRLKIEKELIESMFQDIIIRIKPKLINHFIKISKNI